MVPLGFRLRSATGTIRGPQRPLWTSAMANRAQSPTAAAEEAVVKGSRAHRLTPVSGSSAVPGVDEVPIEPDLPHARESDAEPEAASGPTISPEQIGEPRPAPGSWLSPWVLATHM